MKTSKKVLGVILALVMLVNVFAMFSYAAAPDSAVDLYLTPDKASYSAGETVTFTVSVKVDPKVGDIRIGGRYPIAYDSSVITPPSEEKDGPAKNFGVVYMQAGYDDANSTINNTDDAINVSGVTLDATHNWNSIMTLGINDDGATGFSGTTKVDLFSFQMKLTDTVADGDYVVGYNVGSYKAYDAYLNDQANGGIYGYDEDYGYGTTANYGFVNATIHVGAPAPAGPVVTKAKSQVKMTATSATTVADEFSFRVISKISDSDWDTYFKNTGVKDAKDSYITAVGMVAYKGAAAFDADTAKRVVAGESVADYTAATTDYISKVNDTADAEFGAIIKANHSTLNNDVTYMGFVQYVDASGNAQTIFYETAGTAALSTNYTNIVNAYLARYPFAA